jgi:uncharacterized protein (DUF1501 family)
MTKMNRRSFLKLAAAGVCGSLIHRTLFPDGGLMAYAMPPVLQGALGPNPILIVLNFAGGADLNAMSCIYDSWYLARNPTLAYTPDTSIPLSAAQGLHPALTLLRTLWDEKSFALVNMVGTGVNGMPSYTRAHDLDTETKLSGYPTGASIHGGWAPRLTAQMSSSLGGIAMADQSLVTQGDVNPPRAIGNLQNFGESYLFWGDRNTWFRQTRDNIIIDADTPTNAKHKMVRDSILSVETAAQTLAERANVTLPVTFPASSIGQNMRDIAKIVNANVGAQFFFVQQGGYDTHSGAKATITTLLTDVNNALTALVGCAKAQGWWSRVMLLTLSEFGRTMENGNFGNDHGFSNAMWVMGGAINGGRIVAPPPTAADLGGGSYVRNYHVDFRTIFKEAIAAMGYKADAVFPQPIANSAYTPSGLFV